MEDKGFRQASLMELSLSPRSQSKRDWVKVGERNGEMAVVDVAVVMS